MEQELLKRVKTVVREIEPDAEIYLYGSWARQDSRTDSDWDFLILVDGAVNAAARIVSGILSMKSNWKPVMS